MHKLALRLGVNYAWGLFNFTLGTVLGAGTAGFILGVVR
jgi:hypothetical protein